MKLFHTLVAVAGIAAAGSAAYWYQNKPAAGTALAAADLSSAPGRAASAGVPGVPGGAGSATGPVTVEVGKVEVMALQDETQAVGTLRSRQGVMLRPEVSGRISRLGFADGQRVRRGQLLVQLDATLQQAQLLQAKAQASIARTNLQRNRDLMAQNFVSQSAADQSAAALEVADAQVALAQAQLSRMSIVAPFDGLAGIRVVNIGDYVKDGADLVNVEDVSAMVVDFRLPEGVISRLKPGQAVDVNLDGLPGRSFTGKVDAVDSQLDANGRSLLVRARVDNPQGLLRPGMFARARIVFEVRNQAIVVPEEALVPQGGKQYLVKVLDGAGGKVSQRVEAKIGLRVPGKVEILEGLAVGDVVVVAGQNRLLRADGQAVKVVDISAGAAARPARAASQPSAGPRAPAASAV
jgi:membrane fusion protein, multidrug efflux system